MFGVINIYKPRGLTSHDVVEIIRKILKIKQVGHTGTLDPFAEGVLPICVGKATRLIDYFDDDKEYLATVKFGTSTDTYDTEGKITKTSDKIISASDIEKNLVNFRGEISQLPPMYSAVKVNGKKLYEYARVGETVQIEPRKVTIYKLELESFNEAEQTAKIRVKCSKGTYIRSIANDLGEELGCYAHLSALVRTRSGKFNVQNSKKLPVKILPKTGEDKFIKYEIFENAKEEILSAIQSPLDALSLPIVEVEENEHIKISHGNSIKKDIKNINSGDFLILFYNNNVDAVGQFDGTEIKVKKVLLQ